MAAEASASTSAVGCRSIEGNYSRVEKPRKELVVGGSMEPLKGITPGDRKMF
jgi:hypothetical protein